MVDIKLNLTNYAYIVKIVKIDYLNDVLKL
jgi:hypothetical protein